jgi:hypothetical protein
MLILKAAKIASGLMGSDIRMLKLFWQKSSLISFGNFAPANHLPGYRHVRDEVGMDKSKYNLVVNVLVASGITYEIQELNIDSDGKEISGDIDISYSFSGFGMWLCMTIFPEIKPDDNRGYEFMKKFIKQG